MKEIHLVSMTVPNMASPYLKHHVYKVSLGNGYTFETKNFNSAKAFLARTNRFLNLKLHALNDLYSQVFSTFRANWFYMDMDPALEKSSNEKFEQINQKLHLLCSRSSWSNGNYLVFKNLSDIIIHLSDICQELASLQYKKSNMPEYHRICILKNTLSVHYTQIQNWGHLP